MSQRKQVLIILTIGIILFSIGYLFETDYAVQHNICNDCYHLSLTWTPPLALGGLVLIILSFPFLFVRESIFNSWKYFAKIGIPIGIVLLILAPSYSIGGFMSFGPDFDKRFTSWLVSILFLLISLIIIIRGHFRNRQRV